MCAQMNNVLPRWRVFCLFYGGSSQGALSVHYGVECPLMCCVPCGNPVYQRAHHIVEWLSDHFFKQNSLHFKVHWNFKLNRMNVYIIVCCYLNTCEVKVPIHTNTIQSLD